MHPAGINAITVCVGYDDFLRLTIPRIMRHVQRLVVVTAPTDTRTQELVAQYDKATCFVTDAFYRQGASFNKGWAIEEGFDQLGRSGWILILDADILLPESVPGLDLQTGKLYTPPRRIMSDVDGLTTTPCPDMATLPLRKEAGNFGYFQLFHADDPVLAKRPWYETDWIHAGGADSVFEKRWSRHNKCSLPFEVVHLGDPDQNWFGRVRPRIDTGDVDPEAHGRLKRIESLHRKYGWKGRKKTGEPVPERLGQTKGIAEPCHDHTPKPQRVANFTPVKTVQSNHRGRVEAQQEPKLEKQKHRPPNPILPRLVHPRRPSSHNQKRPPHS